MRLHVVDTQVPCMNQMMDTAQECNRELINLLLEKIVYENRLEDFGIISEDLEGELTPGRAGQGIFIRVV